MVLMSLVLGGVGFSASASDRNLFLSRRVKELVILSSFTFVYVKLLSVSQSLCLAFSSVSFSDKQLPNFACPQGKS